MHISEVTVTNFRNLEELNLSLSPSVNLFIGENGQGKTNILEALYVLGAVKSFRTSKSGDLIRWESPFAEVQGRIEDRLGDFSLGVRIEKTKSLIFNGNPTSLQGFLGKLLLVGFSPDDLSLVKDGPQLRRQFLDRMIADLYPHLLMPLLNFHRALKQKQSVLRTDRATPQLLTPWNRIIADETARLMPAKSNVLAHLQSQASRLYREFSSDELSLSLSLKTNVRSIEPDKIFAQLESEAHRECNQRFSVLGMQRDDFVVELGSHDARSFASQGQVRSIVLALKLAFIELLEEVRGDSPVVLLDDVNSELDLFRVNRFFQVLITGKRQVVITSTDAVSRVDGAALYEVKKGRVSVMAS